MAKTVAVKVPKVVESGVTLGPKKGDKTPVIQKPIEPLPVATGISGSTKAYLAGAGVIVLAGALALYLWRRSK